MKAGELRHRITIQQKDLQRDALGGETSAWVDYAEVWAAIWPVSGREMMQDMALQGQVTHKIRIRYLDGVLAEMQILFGTRVFRITTPPINFEERNKYQDLLCLEVTP
jgi:SPP1 family predicted phage head-tail adaptor